MSDDAPLEIVAGPTFQPRFSDLALTVVLALVLFIVPIALYELLVGDVPYFGQGDLTQGAVLVAVALEAAALVGAVYGAVLLRRRIGWRDFGLRPVDSRWLIAAAVIGLGCVLLLTLIVAGTQIALDRPITSPQAGMIAPEGFSWIGLLLMVPLGGFAVPLAEELIFRGLLYRWLRRHASVTASAVLSALLFGAVHGQPEVVAGGFVVGIVLALVYERSRSLWPPIIIHTVQNSVSIVLMYLSVA
ncbi:MAG TPA: CPBP family intramembrane glutamic endopeptidase [Alphaproteobacteria bacterium]|jgi:membrane protease YdiL (CAAX protease family)